LSLLLSEFFVRTVYYLCIFRYHNLAVLDTLLEFIPCRALSEHVLSGTLGSPELFLSHFLSLLLELHAAFNVFIDVGFHELGVTVGLDGFKEHIELGLWALEGLNRGWLGTWAFYRMAMVVGFRVKVISLNWVVLFKDDFLLLLVLVLKQGKEKFESVIFESVVQR
jgi:hypothetical protein